MRSEYSTDRTDPTVIDEELSTDSRARLQRFFSQEVMDYETLKSNVGLDPQRQLNMAREIKDNLQDFIPILQWSSFPTYTQLAVISDLLWRHFEGSRLGSGSVRSARQLAYLINRLRSAPTAFDLIQSQMDSISDADRAVQQVLDFLRLWANFHFPRLLRGLDKIHKDVFRRAYIEPGDYEFFATKVENYFLDPAIVALDEYGIPLEVARKLQAQINAEAGLDTALDRLRTLDLDATDLTDFEKRLVMDARDGF